MARQVVWTHEAVSDLEAIADYIARDSAAYASAVLRELLDAGNSLDRFCRRGRVVPETRLAAIRELIVREYRLIYRVEQTRIVIVTIVHGRRDLRKLWSKAEKNKKT
ncbi:MAG: type II toxin-antitoxin system RelE/ParE family toxin [Syntrophales bacterium]|jgi:addiction module RelE/StbE family toxin|nr:type II toxin-antitoxin system RelE/ParE family toxin [Syntrophales bacterium]